MRIISYNVNGIRAAISKGLIDWIARVNPDIFCVQETKAQIDQVDLEPFIQAGYHVSWHHAQKKGYSGVATFSKKAPDVVTEGMGMERYDSEGRVLRTDYGDITLLNCYFPSGTTGEVRQAVKMDFLEDFYHYAHDLMKTRKKCIILGDMNIAHEEIDIHDPKGNKNNSGFLPEERAWMTKWLKSGMTDTYRFLHPDKVEYSWWTFRMNARANNKGWRIDYIHVTDNLKGGLQKAWHESAAMHSDHCPVILEMKNN
jgi:exodeoxyribonuclease-3